MAAVSIILYFILLALWMQSVPDLGCCCWNRCCGHVRLSLKFCAHGWYYPGVMDKLQLNVGKRRLWEGIFSIGNMRMDYIGNIWHFSDRSYIFHKLFKPNSWVGRGHKLQKNCIISGLILLHDTFGLKQSCDFVFQITHGLSQEI